MKNLDKKNRYTDEFVFFDLKKRSYELIDVYSNETDKLYYYFDIKEKLNDVILNEIIRKLHFLLPEALYIKLIKSKID